MFAQRKVLTPDGVMLIRGNQIGPGKRSILKLHERIRKQEHNQEIKKAEALVEQLTSEDTNGQ